MIIVLLVSVIPIKLSSITHYQKSNRATPRRKKKGARTNYKTWTPLSQDTEDCIRSGRQKELGEVDRVTLPFESYEWRTEPKKTF